MADPGTVLRRVSVPANSFVDVMTGTEFEYPGPFGNKLTVAALTEGAAGSGQLTVKAGTRTPLENGNIQITPAAGSNPVLPDNLVFSGRVRPGERLQVRLINTTGAAVIMVAFAELS